MKFCYRKTCGDLYLFDEISDCQKASQINISFDEDIDEVCDFLTLTSGKKPVIIPESYKNLQAALNLTVDELFHAIPKNTLQDSLKKLSNAVRIALEDKENEDYLVTYLEIKRFLRSLSPVLVDKQKLDRIIQNENHIGTIKRIGEFSPDKSGFPKKTKYKMTETTTGRLTISEGPQILTAKSCVRSSFQSRFPKGQILQIDLIAAEPNIALKAAGKSFAGDVYSHLSSEVLEGKVSRKESKLITLSALYGQSYKNLTKILPESVSAASVVRKTREFFDVDSLESLLYHNLKRNQLRNVLGRPIFLREQDKRLCVNYYLQSSAAEISSLLFSSWCNTMKDQIVPNYIIHDALVVDCKKELSEELLEKKIISLRLGDWRFDAKVTQAGKDD